MNLEKVRDSLILVFLLLTPSLILITMIIVVFNYVLLVYKDDNEFIPKNSMLVVKRVPVTHGSLSLISKLRGSQRCVITFYSPISIKIYPYEYFFMYGHCTVLSAVTRSL